MKYATVAAVAFAALAQAQDGIPSCAKPCLDDSVTKNTKCSITDIACVCNNFQAIQGDATGCVLEKCGQEVAISMPASFHLVTRTRIRPRLSHILSDSLSTPFFVLVANPAGIGKVLPATKALCANAGGSSSGSSSQSTSAAPSSEAPSSTSGVPSTAPTADTSAAPTSASPPASASSAGPQSSASNCDSASGSQPTNGGAAGGVNGNSTSPSGGSGSGSGSKPGSPVTAGAAGLVPAGSLALLALGAFLL